MKTTFAQRDEIAALYEAGVKSASIAARYGITVQRVSFIARERGCPPRKGSRSRLTEEQKEAVLALYAAGVKLCVIGAQFGVSDSYACQLAQRHGIRHGQRPHV